MKPRVYMLTKNIERGKMRETERRETKMRETRRGKKCGKNKTGEREREGGKYKLDGVGELVFFPPTLLIRLHSFPVSSALLQLTRPEEIENSSWKLCLNFRKFSLFKLYKIIQK